MKNKLLTFSTSLLLSIGAFAQTTNSDISGNKPTLKGYEFNWNIGKPEDGDANLYNCMSEVNPFGAVGYTFSLDNGYLIIDADGTQSNVAFVRFQEGNCNNSTIDLSSDVKKQMITFKVRANATTQFAILAGFEKEQQLLMADLEFEKVDLEKDIWVEKTVTIPVKGLYSDEEYVDVDFTKLVGIFFQVESEKVVKIEVDYVIVGESSIITQLTEAEIAALNVKVFPNPASDVVNVSYNVPADESVVVTLSNSLGQEVASVAGSSSSASIDVAGLNGGLYFASVVVDGIVVATQKVIVE